MEYQNIDEAARREACEKVKQIVKAIKAIKIKYYLNFSKISEEDQQKYGILEENLEKISRAHNLVYLAEELKKEVSDKYDRKDIKSLKDSKDPEDILKACYGVIDVQVTALKQLKIKSARKCQEDLKKYMQEIENKEYIELIKNYKREKIGELINEREKIEEKNQAYSDLFRGFYRLATPEERKNLKEKLGQAKNKSKELFAQANIPKEKEAEEESQVV